MLNLPGHVFRRTAQTVSTVASVATNVATGVASGTVGAVRGTLGLERPSEYSEATEEFIMQNAKEKVNIQLKGTPSKDCATMVALSVRHHTMMKRNEQGSWHRKIVCLVPHMFLYYFDSDTSDSPRGIIDLYFYNDVAVEGEGNILKLSAPEETNLRSFYFQIDDPNLMSEMITSLHRDRYNVIRDERDAYQQLQDQFSGHMDQSSKLQESHLVEKAKLEAELTIYRSQAEAAIDGLQRGLAKLGTTEEEMGNLRTLTDQGKELVRGIVDLRERLDLTINESEKERNEMKETFESRVAMLEKQLAQEQEARRLSEATRATEKAESDGRIRELMVHCEKVSVNLQMMMAAKTAAESKNATEKEQKKVLVKEVKQLRRKVEEANEAVESLKGLNDRLSNAVTALQKQNKLLLGKISVVPSVASNSNSAAPSPTPVASEMAESEDNSSFLSSSPNLRTTSTEAQISLQEEHTETSTEALSPEQQDLLNIDAASLKFTDEKRRLSQSSTAKDEDDDDAEEAPKQQRHSQKFGVTSVADNERSTWDMPPAANLGDLAWLAPEQRHLIEGRKSNSNSSDGGVTGTPQPGRSDSDSTPSHGSSGMSLFSRSSAHPSPSGASGSSGSTSGGGFFSSLFTHDKVSAAPALQADDLFDSPDEKLAAASRRSSVTKSVNSEEVLLNSPFQTREKMSESGEATHSKPDSDSKVRCLRCNGTVEGPKYSTCKCAIPALSPADLNSPPAPARRSSLFGMLSVGSQVAGGLAGGAVGAMGYAVKATSSGVGSLMKSSQESVDVSPHKEESSGTTTKTTAALLSMDDSDDSTGGNDEASMPNRSSPHLRL